MGDVFGITMLVIAIAIAMWIMLIAILFSVIFEDNPREGRWDLRYFCSSCNEHISEYDAIFGRCCPHCGIATRNRFGLSHYRISGQWKKVPTNRPKWKFWRSRHRWEWAAKE